jgi:hypothetical protein
MELPTKIFYDAVNKVFRNSAGTEITDKDLYPSATFGQKFWMNVQLVSDDASPGTKYSALPTGTTADVLVDNDYLNPSPILPVPGGNDDWTAGTGSEYYYNGTDILTKPTIVYENSVQISEGTKGALTAGTWAWDAVALKLYVRLTDSTDPDTKTAGYVEFKETVTATLPFIEVDGSTFNQANSWYDTATLAFRNPVIADGELSFYITANTLQFYRRLGTDDEITNATMQIQLLAPSTAINFDVIEFPFVCRNKYLGQGYSVDVTGSNIYTKAEVLALIAGFADLLSGTQATLTDNATTNINLFNKTTARKATVEMYAVGAAGIRDWLSFTVTFFGAVAYLQPASYSDNGTISGSITLNADISGNNVRLNVTLAGCGENLKLVYRTSQTIIEV